MYVCTCVCIHVHVCHVYIVCHKYINTCMYLFVVHLDIILLVVSDADDSNKGCKPLFENPEVIEVHQLHGVFVLSEDYSVVHKSSPREVLPAEPCSPATRSSPHRPTFQSRVCCFGGKKS